MCDPILVTLLKILLYYSHSFIHSFCFAFKKKYNNSIQKYIKDNIQYSNYVIYKIKCGKGKEACIEAGGL